MATHTRLPWERALFLGWNYDNGNAEDNAEVLIFEGVLHCICIALNEANLFMHEYILAPQKGVIIC